MAVIFMHNYLPENTFFNLSARVCYTVAPGQVFNSFN